MASKKDINLLITEIARRKGVFKPEAYFFVLQALEAATSDFEEKKHITGEDLLEVIREVGQERYGPMTGDVFNSWGVRSTLDFGRVVFHLVDARLLGKRDQDSLTDFLDIFDFQEAFALRVFDAQRVFEAKG